MSVVDRSGQKIDLRGERPYEDFAEGMGPGDLRAYRTLLVRAFAAKFGYPPVLVGYVLDGRSRAECRSWRTERNRFALWLDARGCPREVTSDVLDISNERISKADYESNRSRAAARRDDWRGALA